MPGGYCVTQSWMGWNSLTHLQLLGGRSQIHVENEQRMMELQLTASHLAVLGIILVLGGMSD